MDADQVTHVRIDTDALSAPGVAELYGAELLDLPRTASITAAEVDRAITALTVSVALWSGLPAADEEGPVRSRELRRMLLLMNTMRDEFSVSPTMPVAPALLTRAARCLDLAGDISSDVDLGSELHRDATALRSRAITGAGG